MLIAPDHGQDTYAEGESAAVRLVRWFTLVEPKALRDAALMLDSCGTSEFERGYAAELRHLAADLEERAS